MVLYELLAGARPFAAAARTRAALEHAIVQVDPPPPSRAAADAARARALRGDLDTIVLKAMKKQPADRYASATALADDLHRLLRHEPVRAQRDSGWYRARKFATRNALPLGLGAALAVALIGLSGAALWQARAASESAEQANTIKEFVLSIIRQGDPLASAQNRASDLALLIAAESRIAQELRQRPQLALEMQLAIGNAYANRGEYARASAHVARRHRGGAPGAARHRPHADRRADPHGGPADHRWRGGRGGSRSRHRRVAGGTARRPPVCWSMHCCSGTSCGAGRRSGEGPWRCDARRWRSPRDADVNDEARALVVANELALMLSSAGRAPQALGIVEPAYRRAIQSGAFAAADPRLIEARSWYGRVLCQNGRAGEGMPLLEQAEREAREHHGPTAQVTAVVLGNVAFGLHLSGALPRAVPLIVEAHDIVARREPPGSHYRSLRRTYAVELTLLARRPDIAERLVAVTPYDSLRGPERLVERSLWIGRGQAGWLRLEQGDAAGAKAELEEVVERLDAWKMKSIAMRYRLHLATARLRLGQLQAAAGAAEEVRRFFQQHDPKGVRLAQAQLVLGEIRFASGAYAASLALAEEVLQWRGRRAGIDSTNVDAALPARAVVGAARARRRGAAAARGRRGLVGRGCTRVGARCRGALLARPRLAARRRCGQRAPHCRDRPAGAARVAAGSRSPARGTPGDRALSARRRACRCAMSGSAGEFRPYVHDAANARWRVRACVHSRGEGP